MQRGTSSCLVDHETPKTFSWGGWGFFKINTKFIHTSCCVALSCRLVVLSLCWPRDDKNFSLRGWGFFNIKTKFIHASLSCRLVISWFLRRKFRSPHTLGWYNSNKTVNTIIAITGNLGPWLLPQICKLDKTQFKWKLISTELTQVQGGPGCLCLLSKQGGRSNFL